MAFKLNPSQQARYEWLKKHPEHWAGRYRAIWAMKLAGLLPMDTYWRDAAWGCLLKQLQADGLIPDADHPKHWRA